MEDLVKAFLDACAAEARCVAKLSEALESERAVLLSGETADLGALAKTKTEHLTELHALGQMRSAVMRLLGVTDQDALNTWLADKPEALAAWEELSSALMRTQAINRVNGEMLQKRIDFVDQSLSVLKAAASATLGYGRDGTQPSGLTGGRHLGSA
jgi:flagella synthesis protein FlgN